MDGGWERDRSEWMGDGRGIGVERIGDRRGIGVNG